MQVSVLNRIINHVENSPLDIKLVFNNAFAYYDIGIIGFELKAAVPCTDFNLSWGIKNLKDSFAKKLINDFNAGKELPF